ncbi:MAG TPA: hypothetical protein VHU81_12005 [Thermoanaerobaculia bacterium]|jgi:hypothetical protein|nr:hypothetical protein [Thermoanaerobaculia bacterium]
MSDERAEKLLAYLRLHGDRYSVEALRQQMLSEGYSGEEIDAAIQRWTEDRRPEPGGVLGLSFLVGLGDIALTALSVWAGTSQLGNAPQWWHPSRLVPIALPFLLLAQVGVGLGMLFFPRHRRMGRVLLFGFVWYIVLSILAGGAFCLYAMSGAH